MDTGTLISSANIVSAGVATLAVNVATNALYALMKIPPKVTAFISSLIIAYVLVAMAKAPEWYEWVLAFFNACLLFCSALGLNEFSAKALAPSGQGAALRKPLIVSWL